MMYYFFLGAFLFNTGLASRRVSQRCYGWATGYALSAIFSAMLAAVEYAAVAA